MNNDAKRSPARRAAEVGLLAALAMALSYMERLIPPLIPAAPGVKLGLANIATLFAMYQMGVSEAFMVTLVRCTLASLLFGSGTSLAFSLCGGLLSVGVMALMMHIPGVGELGTSMAGAAAHNTGQIAVAATIMRSAALFSYLGWLLLLSIPLGALIALSYQPFKRVMPYIRRT